MWFAAFVLLVAANEAPSSLPVTFLSDAEIRRAVHSAPEERSDLPGLYSLRLSDPSEQVVIGIRRTSPGKSELHTKFADVWYVLEGAGTLVTGGTISEGVESPAGEIRGQGIVGGKSRRIQRGDFAVIPPGVPHWISTVDGDELLYLVVKVPSE